MVSSYYENLIQMVIESSVGNRWSEAVYEWEIIDCIEDDFNESSCICGKENIKYLFKIINIKNNNVLFPIGSSCIKKFNREDFNELASIKEKLFQLLHDIQKFKFISLNSDYFSRNLLRYLYEEGAFRPTTYNNYDGKKDYLFMLDMFNKRNEPTENQQKKIRAIIVSSIKPYLVAQLKDKVVNKY